MRAQVHGDAAPALELVGARGAVLHAAALVVVVEAGGARHVVVGFSAAAQALAVATLALVCTGECATFRTYWGDREGWGGDTGDTDVRQFAQRDAVPTKSRMMKVKKEAEHDSVCNITAAVDGHYGFKMSHF